MNYSRRDFLKSIGLAAASLTIPGCNNSNQSSAEISSAKKPNFIIIFADDQGYQDVGCFGSPDINTPNLDRMASEGMKFTDFYSAASVCSPSRAALLTGYYPPRVSITKVLFPRDNIGLNPKEITIADTLKARGYSCACIGKWHLGHLPEFLPTSNGFDSYFGIP
jgi:arylsulfatase A